MCQLYTYRSTRLRVGGWVGNGGGGGCSMLSLAFARVGQGVAVGAHVCFVHLCRYTRISGEYPGTSKSDGYQVIRISAEYPYTGIYSACGYSCTLTRPSRYCPVKTPKYPVIIISAGYPPGTLIPVHTECVGTRVPAGYPDTGTRSKFIA